MKLQAPKIEITLDDLQAAPVLALLLLNRATDIARTTIACQHWNGNTLVASITGMPEIVTGQEGREIFAIGARLEHGRPVFVMAVAQLSDDPRDGRYYIAAKAETPELLIQRVIAYASAGLRLAEAP